MPFPRFWERETKKLSEIIAYRRPYFATVRGKEDGTRESSSFGYQLAWPRRQFGGSWGFPQKFDVPYFAWTFFKFTCDIRKKFCFWHPVLSARKLVQSLLTLEHGTAQAKSLCSWPNNQIGIPWSCVLSQSWTPVKNMKKLKLFLFLRTMRNTTL